MLNPGNEWGDNPRVQGPDFYITGMPHPGTLAQQIAVKEAQVHPVPEHLSDVEAAGLPLAGVTAFRALFSRGELQRGEKNLITGEGGGVSTIVISVALEAGARVYVN